MTVEGLSPGIVVLLSVGQTILQILITARPTTLEISNGLYQVLVHVCERALPNLIDDVFEWLSRRVADFAFCAVLEDAFSRDKSHRRVGCLHDPFRSRHLTGRCFWLSSRGFGCRLDGQLLRYSRSAGLLLRGTSFHDLRGRLGKLLRRWGRFAR